MLNLKDAINIAVLRSKGGSGEHRAVKEVCDNLIGFGAAKIIIRAREDYKYMEPRPAEEEEISMSFIALDEDSGPLPYPYVADIPEANNLLSSNSVQSWEDWDDADVKRVNDLLPNHKVIYTLGLGSAASISTVEKSLSLFDKVFVTVNLGCPGCIDRALDYVKWDLEKNRGHLYVFAWSQRMSGGKGVHQYKIIPANEWVKVYSDLRERALECL